MKVSDESFKKGLEQMKKMGREATMLDQLQLSEDMYRMSVGMLFGEIWTRGELSLRERQLITLAANIALAAGCDLTPVIIHCEPRVGQKAQKWYELPPRLPQFTIEGFPALDRSALIDPAQPRSVQARRLTRALLHFFDARYPTGAT